VILAKNEFTSSYVDRINEYEVFLVNTKVV